MANLADFIEAYIKKLLQESGGGIIELQRSNLANKFNCVPSQINYVLSTRFTTDRGYLVETRRGGGGYIRIVRSTFDRQANLLQILNESIGDSISQRDAEGVLQRFVEEGLLTRREAKIIGSILVPNILRLPPVERDALRASILKGALLAALG